MTDPKATFTSDQLATDSGFPLLPSDSLTCYENSQSSGEHCTYDSFFIDISTNQNEPNRDARRARSGRVPNVKLFSSPEAPQRATCARCCRSGRLPELRGAVFTDMSRSRTSGLATQLSSVPAPHVLAADDIACPGPLAWQSRPELPGPRARSGGGRRPPE